MTTLPIIVYWTIAFWGLFSLRPILIWLFLGSLSFGTLAVIPPSLVSGLTLTGSNMTALLLIVRQFILRRDGLKDLAEILINKNTALLTMFWFYCILVTIFSPNFFHGRIEVTPMSISRFMQIDLLKPSLQNFSQFAYITVSVFTVFAFSSIFRDLRMRNMICSGLIFASVLTILTGLLDLLKLDMLLEPFRTANYALLVDVHISNGAKRVTGLMSEASSFGGLSLTLLTCVWFLRYASIKNLKKRLISCIILGLGAMVMLSTSSASYVGAASLLIIAFLDWTLRCTATKTHGHQQLNLRMDFILSLSGLAIILILILIFPKIIDPIILQVKELIFDKTESLSYLERSFWTKNAIVAGYESYLIGVGLGSLRASNFLAALFGSTGFIGAGLYLAFILQRLFQKNISSSLDDRRIVTVMKLSFFPPFFVSLLSSTTPDFGVFSAMQWGLLVALSRNGSNTAAVNILNNRQNQTLGSA